MRGVVCDRRDGGTLPKYMTCVSVVPLWQYFSEDHILISLRKEYVEMGRDDIEHLMCHMSNTYLLLTK